MRYYKPFSRPLVELQEDDIPLGGVVYDELGRCVQKIFSYSSGNFFFVEVVPSVLREGEILSDLTDNQLQLFWALSKNRNIIREFELRYGEDED